MNVNNNNNTKCDDPSLVPIFFATPDVNFIYVLYGAFTHADPKNVKIQLSCQYLFTLLGSALVKAARRTLMKLTPDVNIIIILLKAIRHVGPKSKKRH
jgi:hypothetical protein